MKNLILFDKMITMTSIKWQQVLEDLNMFKGMLLKLSLTIYPGFSKEVGIATYLFAKQIYRMGKRSGWLFVVLYCKQSAVCLQKYYGGDSVIPVAFPIKLTRCGLPRIIPSFHRQMIRRHDARGDLLVKLYLSYFSISKCIPLCARVSKKTFKSIVTPLTPSQEESVTFFTELFVRDLPDLLSRYLPWLNTLPLLQGIQWKPSWKALPNYAAKRIMRTRDLSPYTYLPLEFKVFGSLLQFIHGYGAQMSPLILWLKRIRFAFDSDNNDACLRDLKIMEDAICRYPVNCEDKNRQLYTWGRLCQSCSGNGKRRIFAIGNFVCQCLLRPIFDWSMNVLKRIPCDGTYNQTKPIHNLLGSKFAESIDLSAATDRFPLRLLFHVVEAMFGSNYASSVVNSTLACHIFAIDPSLIKGRRPMVKDSPFQKLLLRSHVSFIVGQPLGLYSSWSLFALAHHAVVWWAANRVYPGKVFKGYALLGDDIVITDPGVSRTYKDIMKMLAVDVSVQKSLTSHSGCCEFAKQFWVNNISKDLSPVSFKLILGTHHLKGLLALSVKFPQLSIKQLLSIKGYGYKVKARILAGKLNLGQTRLMSSILRYKLPFKIWFDGLAMDPSVVGILLDQAFMKLAPKSILIPPDELLLENDSSKCQSLNEITLYREALLENLQYHKKYWLLYNDAYFLGRDPWLVLEDLFDLKPGHTDWKINKTDQLVVRFGLLFKLYDKRKSNRRLALPMLPSNTDT